jgi:hypothetical protein
MYVSYQIQRMQAAETMTAVERRAADDELGRLLADLSWLAQRIASPARAFGRALPVGWRSVTVFRNRAARMDRSEGPAICPRLPASSPETIANSSRSLAPTGPSCR